MQFGDGPLALGGAIVDGRGIRAAEILGADFANIGTRFIATTECMASDGYKQMLIDSVTKDVVCTPYFTGVRANYLIPSIVQAGIDPAVLTGEKPAIDLSGGEAKAWKNIWSGGHGVFATKRVVSTAELVHQLTEEYRLATATYDRTGGGGSIYRFGAGAM